MRIVDARAAWLAELGEVVRASITELCGPDHGHDPERLEPWLAERSTERLGTLLFEPGSRALACREDGRILGLAHLSARGVLTVCYVHPEQAGRGIGGRLLAAIEQHARAIGLRDITALSTRTARGFYRAHGFEPEGAEVRWVGLLGQPMRKRLGPAPAP